MKKKAEMKRSPAPAQSQHPEAERAFAKVIGAFAGDREVVYGGGKGFGSTALRVRGKVFAMISSKGKFVAKLPSKRVDELVRLGTGEYFDPGRGRLMKEWVALDRAHSSWITIANEARRFVAGEK
jgi:hypothetical protein